MGKKHRSQETGHRPDENLMPSHYWVDRGRRGPEKTPRESVTGFLKEWKTRRLSPPQHPAGGWDQLRLTALVELEVSMNEEE